jgi:hypothetical protein
LLSSTLQPRNPFARSPQRAPASGMNGAHGTPRSTGGALLPAPIVGHVTWPERVGLWFRE